MKTVPYSTMRYVPSLLLLVSLIGSMLFAGCTDSLFSEPESEADAGGITYVIEETPVSSKYAKLRHPQLLDRAKSQTTGASKTGSEETVYDLIVEFDEDRIRRRVLDKYEIRRRILNKFSGPNGNQVRQRVEFDEIMKGITLQVREAYLDSLLDYLQNDPDIVWIDPDIVMEPNMPVLLPNSASSTQVVPWGVERVGARLSALESDKVHIIIMDSGITEGGDLGFDRGADFTQLFINRDQEYWDDEYEQETPVYDPKDEGDMRDFTGHGTHMAGTISAPDDDDGVIGVAPGAKIHSLKVLTEDGKTDITTTVAAVDLLTFIKTEKPDIPMIVNLSLGADIGTTAYNALDEAVARSIAAGVIFVVSAGNDGRDASTYSPAHVEGAITVGAYDLNNRFASFSNYGPVVDILAPGTDIVSLPHEFVGSDDLVVLDGTSSAAAHVTGAAALYVSRHPEATPQEVRDALVSMGQAVIENTPANTTNVSLYVGKAMRNEDADEDFEIGAAQWNAADETLTVSGAGRRLEPVVVRSAFGVTLAVTVVNYAAAWSVTLSGLDVAPCDVSAESQGATFDKEVSNAPDGCEQTPTLSKAEWRNNALTIEAQGTMGRAVTLSSTNTGTLLLETTFDPDGALDLALDQLPEIPCSLRLSSDGVDVDRAVSSAPLNCDGRAYLAFSKAEWKNEALVLEGEALSGTGNPTVSVTFTSANTGAFLGTADTDNEGEFAVSFSGLDPAPCTVRAELEGRVEEIAVSNAPRNCDGLPYLKLTRAEWKSPKLKIQGEADANATVTITSAATGAFVASFTAGNDGRFQFEDTLSGPVPCAIRAEVAGRVEELAVNKAPGTCQ